MKKEKNMKYKKAGVGLGLFAMIVFVAGLMILANTSVVNDEIIEKEVFQRVHIWTPLGEDDPGSGASGFLEFFIMNLSDANGYAQNDSSIIEGWCVANMVGKTPYGTADEFHLEVQSDKTCVFGVKARFNSTHLKDGADWFGTDADVQITLTCTDWAVGSNIGNVSGTLYESSNDSSFDFFYGMWIWDNSGTGYQFGDDCTWTLSEIYIEAKF